MGGYAALQRQGARRGATSHGSLSESPCSLYFSTGVPSAHILAGARCINDGCLSLRTNVASTVLCLSCWLPSIPLFTRILARMSRAALGGARRPIHRVQGTGW